MSGTNVVLWAGTCLARPALRYASEHSCLKPKVAIVIVLVTFIVLSYEIYARFTMTVDMVTVDV